MSETLIENEKEKGSDKNEKRNFFKKRKGLVSESKKVREENTTTSQNITIPITTFPRKIEKFQG